MKNSGSGPGSSLSSSYSNCVWGWHLHREVGCVGWLFYIAVLHVGWHLHMTVTYVGWHYHLAVAYSVLEHSYDMYIYGQERLYGNDICELTLPYGSCFCALWLYI